MKKLLYLYFAVFITSCAIPADVIIIPVPATISKNICIIDNPNVLKKFQKLFRKLLEDKAFIVKLLPYSSSIQDCITTVTYQVHGWRDFTTNLSYAYLKVFKDGLLVAKASYFQSRSFYSRLDNAESKFAELANKLFP